jgi:hypothetical protein
MAGRRPLAEDDGSAQALSMMRTTLGRDRCVTVGLEEALVERCQVLSEYPEIIGYYIY